MKAYVICSSHRSRETLNRCVTDKTQNYFNLDKNYQLTEINADKLQKALEITGIRMGKMTDGWMKCWKVA